MIAFTNFTLVTVLITGGASYIGSHLAEFLVDAGARVPMGDDLSSGRFEHLEGIAQKIRLVLVYVHASEPQRGRPGAAPHGAGLKWAGRIA